MSCVIRCILLLELAILLMLEWQDHITRTFLSVDIYRSMIFHKWTRNIGDCHKNFPVSRYLYDETRLPNWKNVLCLCVWYFANWKNVMCHGKNFLRFSAAVRCVSHVYNSYDKVTLIFDNKVNLATLDLSESSQLSGSTSGSKNITNHTIFQS